MKLLRAGWDLKIHLLQAPHMTGEETEAIDGVDQGHSQSDGNRAGTRTQGAFTLLQASPSLKEMLVASSLLDE